MKTDELRVLYERLDKGPFRLRDGTPVIRLVAKDKDKVVIHLPGGQKTEVYKKQLKKLLIRDSGWTTRNIQKSHDASEESLQKAKDTRAIDGRSNRTSREKNRKVRFPETQGFHPRRGKAVVGPKLKRIKDHIRRLEKQGKHTFVFTKLFGDAEYNFNLAREGKGVHNPEYAEELIEAAKRNLD